MTKEVWIGWISSLIEAYNMAIYNFVAPLLGLHFFQKASQESAVFFSYSLVFIGSCLLYPVGSIYYGLIGDKKGRQKTCVYSTLGLGIATGLMGLISFHSWIYFLILICIQHFFSGGEYHGSIVFSLEHGEAKQSGVMSALSCLFAVFGLVLANGLATLSFFMQDEVWIRICFLIGGMGGLISYLLKNYCRETPPFIRVSQKSLEPIPLRNFIRSEWQTIGRVVAVLAFFMVSYSFIFIFLPLMQIEGDGFDTFKSLIMYGVFLLAAGVIGDRIGIERAMKIGVLSFSTLIIPLCYAIKDLLALQIALTLCAAFVIGPIHSWMLQQFEVQNRCRGIFISSAIATSIFGGSTVPICLMIFKGFSSLIICAIYPFIVGLGSLIFNKRTKQVFV